MLVITDLNNNSEPLIDYTDLKRKRRPNSEKTISFTTFPSEKNGDAIHLVDVESQVEYDGDIYIIKSCDVIADGDSYYKVVSATMKFYVDLIGIQQPLIHNGSLTFVEALNFVFGGTSYTYTINGTFNSQVFENLGNTNRLALLSTIVNRYKAEFIVVNNNAFFYEEAGTETDITFRYAQNVTSLDISFDSKDLATVIKGTGANIGTEEAPKYITATYTSPNVGKFGEIEADPIRDERFATEESLRNYLKEILQDEPIISLRVSIAILEEQGIEELNEGDYVYLIYEPIDDLELYVRVVEIEEIFDIDGNLVDIAVTLSNFEESLEATFTDSIDVKISEERKVITNIIQQAANGKNTIYRGPTEPQGDDLKEGDLWYQPTGDGETKMYQYTGTHWELILDTAKTTEIANKVDEAFEDAQSAIDAAANAQLRADQANQEAQTALTQAQTSFDTAQNALTQSNNAFASVEALSTRVNEQTGEISSIKQSVSGLQTAVANAEGDISTLTQVTNSIKADVKSVDGRVSTLSVSVDGIASRVTNAEGNISTLTQTTSGLQTRVANAEGDISTLTQTAGALQTRMTNAEGNISTLTQTATSLTSRIDNLQVGGKNMMVKTDFKDTTGWAPWSGRGTLRVEKTIDGSPNALLLHTSGLAVAANVAVGIYQSSPTLYGFNVTGGQEYTVSYYIRSSGIGSMSYCYLIYNDGGGNQKLDTIQFQDCPLVKIGNYDYRKVVHHFKPNRDGVGCRFLIGGHSIADYGAETTVPYMYITQLQMEEGTFATSWDVAPEDISSQITQLVDNINLKVSKNDVVNQINVSTEGILIDGSKVHITGTTTIDNGVIKSAMIANLAADKITTGTLNAANVNIINMNASNIVTGELNGNNITIRGGSATDYTQISGATLTSVKGNNSTTITGGNISSRGNFTRTFSTNQTAYYRTLITSGNGVYKISVLEKKDANGNSLTTQSELDSRGLYLSDKGLSTQPDNFGQSKNQSGRYIDLFAKETYNSLFTYSGMKLFSDSGLDIEAYDSSLVLKSTSSNNIESAQSSIFFRPMRDIRNGNNVFQWYVVASSDTTKTDGVMVYGSDVNGMTSGLRFSKNINDPTVYITAGGGNISSNGLGTGNLIARNITGYEMFAHNLRCNNPGVSFYIGVTSAELAVTDNNLYNNGNPVYQPVRASNFYQSSSRDYKTNITGLDHSGLAVINALKVVEYDLISNIKEGIDDRQVGLIAEDSLTVATKDGRAINTYKLAAYNTKAIQEVSKIQQEEILKRAKLEMEIATLKSEVTRLKERVSELESVA